MKNKLLEILGLEKIIQSLQNLVETRIQLIKNEIEEKITKSIAKAIPILLLSLVAFLFILFGSITLGLYLSVVMDSYVTGFGIITGIYLILTIIVAILSKNEKFNQSIAEKVKKKQ